MAGMKTPRALSLSSIWITALLIGHASLADAPVTVQDLLNLRTATAIDVSSDGRVAVIAVRSVERVDHDADWPDFENRSHLWAIDLLDDDPIARQLTFGRRGGRAPAVSPNGRQVAFLRATEGVPHTDGPTTQVWVMSLDGGEARQLTSLRRGAGAPVWSPDGHRVLTSTGVDEADLDEAPEWPSERPGWSDPADDVEPAPDGPIDAIRAWLDRSASEGHAVVIDRLAFQEEQSLRLHDRTSQLVLVDVESGDATQITSAMRDHESPRFLPDGSAILYVTRATGGRHPDRVVRRHVRRISVDGSDDQVLLSDPEWTFQDPRPSADGSVLGFRALRVDEPNYRQQRLGLATLGPDGASEPMWLTDSTSFDYSIGSFRWMTDRASVAFTAAREGGFPLLTMSLGLLEPAGLVETFEEQPVGVHAFDVAGGALVYATTSPQNPCVVRLRDARGDRVILDLNEWVADRALAVPAMRWITRPDGTRVQYWIMKPPNAAPGERFPLAVEMHGGPSAMWGPGERTMWLEFQVLCSRGFGVMYANPRGSGGYGYAFQRANHQNWGEGPAGDVLAAVDHALLDPWVDADRLVLTGGSYAGYLTAWIVAHDHRFKAAVAQRGVYHLPTFFGEGNAWRLVPWAFGGYPWDPEAQPVLRRESPFTYVARIRTPLLILHASNDLRTGVSQSEMLYRALKVLERPVEYVRYPRAGHDLSRTGDPNQRLDRLLRIIEFFERFAG